MRKKQQNQQLDSVYLQVKSQNQAFLRQSIKDNHLTVCSGAAGVGKTLICLNDSYHMMKKGLIDQILYVKPITSAALDSGLGYLPGDLNEKVLPLLAPVLDNLEVFCSKGEAAYLINKGKILFQPLEYLRGRSLRNTFLIFDEAQNASKHVALSVISRIEESSKCVMLGDPSQCDIQLTNNALSDALVRLKNTKSVGIVQFTKNDIIRSAFLKEVLQKYE